MDTGTVAAVSTGLVQRYSATLLGGDDPRLAAARRLVEQAAEIWISGGWGMIALAINGVIMYAMGSFMLFKLLSKGLNASPDRIWRQWQANPQAVRGPIGRMFTRALACRGLDEIARFFGDLRHEEMSPFERDLKVMKVSVSTAPLLGLLGTVTGMLTTFNALATGGGGEKTMNMVASGISEALITTETGLVLALSGLIFQFTLMRKHERYGKLIAHVETLCTQHFHRVESAGGVRP